MSLAQVVLEQAKSRELKTLVIDVERLPGTFRWDDRYDGLTIEGSFWGLSDFKHKFGRVPYTAVTAWPRTICALWRWIGEKRIHFAAEWENGAEAFIRQVRDALDEADIITGHYVNGADRKWLNTEFRDHRLPWPSPYKVVDTLALCRRELGDESMTLGALCSRFGIPTKVDKYDPNVARAAVAGDKAAQRRLKKYNSGDVEASTGLYFATLPLAKSHPHVSPIAGQTKTLCPRCGSDQVERRGSYTPGVYIYARYVCNACPGTSYFRTTYEGRGPSVKAI